MPRILIGSIADRRVIISLAAFLVKVTASMPCELTWFALIRGNARGQNARLSTARPRQYQRGLLRQGDGKSLFGVETGKQG